MATDRDMWLHDEIAKVSADCPPVEMNAEDPLFILIPPVQQEPLRGSCIRREAISSMRR